VRARYFSVLQKFRLALEPTQFLLQRVPEFLTVGLKRPGCEADQLSSSGLCLRTSVAIHLLPLYFSMACTGTFTFM